ncbi:MAG: glycerol-3-phosphate 1-O-acyltransferase PlsY [Oscillospiraceae bacterium]|jgi:glycerol-3-phosphate acyltransferase PlsY|nr:glycerol-3-phosphate 1-O-acyltransferase PlsY [Oscillospiraceae bacterium]
MNWEIIIILIAAALPAYLLGGLNGAIIVGKALYRKDIRDYGSGNAGLTNFYRTFGKGGSLLVILIDVIKTVTPVLLGGWLFANSYFETPPHTDIFTWYLTFVERFPYMYVNSALFLGQMYAGFFVILGHCFPVYYKFKGGKGVMAIGAIVIVADWRIALIAWCVFVLVVFITRYVSLGAIIGSVSIPFIMLILNNNSWGLAEYVMVTLCVLLVVARHIPNINRLFKGKESKLKLRKKQ